MALALAACALLNAAARAQVPAGAQAPREPFGSSLKRPRADAPGQAAGESARQQDEAQLETVKVDTLLVNLDVVVTDADETRFITGLRMEDFAVTEDGREQRVSGLTLGDDAEHLPRSIVLIFDWSGSQLPFLEESVRAAKVLIDNLARTDQMAIVTDSVYLMTDFTSDKKRLKSSLDALLKQTRDGWRGKSRQFSALLATLRELIDVKTRRPIIIFQTDGDEAESLKDPPGSRSNVAGVYYMSDILREVGESRVKVYTVIPGERLFGLPEEEAEERARRLTEQRMVSFYKFNRQVERPARVPTVQPPVIKTLTGMYARSQEAAARVAEASGGWAEFLDSPGRAGAIYARILADINNHYIVSYYPENKERDGRLRRVRTEVRNHPEYRVHGRQSYYATQR